MSAESVVTDLITDQSGRADEALNAAKQYGDLAQTAAISMTNLGAVPPVVPPVVTIPPPSSVDGAAEFNAAYANAFADFGPQFTAAWQDFIEEFFPEVNGCVQQLSDAWICNTIQFGGTGLPAAIEDAIWQRGRERENLMAAQQIDAAVNEWSGRGFTLPSGALAYRVSQVQQDAVNKGATFNREVAIKAAEIEIENVRFAVQQAVNLRLGAIQAAVAYIAAFFTPVKLAIEKAGQLTDAKYKFYAASSSYYNAIIGAANLTLQARIADANNAALNNRAVADLAVGNAKARVDAAVGSATALGRAAAAALGSVNTLANLANITTEEA